MTPGAGNRPTADRHVHGVATTGRAFRQHQNTARGASGCDDLRMWMRAPDRRQANMKPGRADATPDKRGHWLPVVYTLVGAAYVAALLYICALALDPELPERMPHRLWGFGSPGSHWSIAVVLAIPLVLLGLRRLAGRPPFTSQPLLVIAAMAAIVLVLGMSGYWRCHGDQAPFFAPLAWTLALFLGNVETFDGGACAVMPVALEIARLLALVTTLTAALAAGLQLFRSQVDRLAVRRARALTVIVGIDDETVSMVRAILRSCDPAGTVVVLTGDVESAAARTVRQLGARLRNVNLAEPAELAQLTLWKRLDRLYLMSADPVDNLRRFNAADSIVSTGDVHRRIPLTVRIDDPWQAEVWRRSFLVSAERCWVADAVGKYEVTAAKLVRHMTTRSPTDSADVPEATTVVLCGLYPLTYALVSELAQLEREQRLYQRPHVVTPSNVVIFAQEADSFVRDHLARQRRVAPADGMLTVVALDAEPTVEAITDHLTGADLSSYTIVLGDPALEMQGTRLASRFPQLRVYSASDAATSLIDISIVGELFTFPIDMELDEDSPQDTWERAAELIHEHYSAGGPRDRPTTRSWKDLDPFYRQSNRRLLLNTLWMVEAIGGHTWNSLEHLDSPQTLPNDFAELDPMAQLEVLGFDEQTVERIVAAEHEDWRRYYEQAGWRHAEVRDDNRHRHDRLLPWDELLKRNPESAVAARKSLASTLLCLRNLGYRSVQKRTASTDPQQVAQSGDSQWRRYRRRGEVTAEKRDQPWTWTTLAGEIMQAAPGDWSVVDDSGQERSVAAGVFESTHRQIGPRRYERCGTVLARRASRPELVRTLEGDVTANEGDWIVKGVRGEQWPVRDEQFRVGYHGPVDIEPADRNHTKHPRQEDV